MVSRDNQGQSGLTASYETTRVDISSFANCC
jgi:hypothetical protein